MGFLNRFFGLGDDRSPTKPNAVHVAPGRGFTFDIVGESQFQMALSNLCGGKQNGGHKQEATAHLIPEPNPHDPNAIAIEIKGKRVGWIPSAVAPELRQEIAALNTNGTLACKAKIVGGWIEEGGEGHFGVKLSMSRPLKIRPNA